MTDSLTTLAAYHVARFAASATGYDADPRAIAYALRLLAREADQRCERWLRLAARREPATAGVVIAGHPGEW